MDDAVGAMLDDLDPAAKAMLPPELIAALKKYGKWSKIPKAERAKLLGKLAGSTAAIVGGAASSAGHALASDDDATRAAANPNDARRAQLAGPAQAATPPQPAASRPRAPGLGADGWVVSRRFSAPGFDPKHLSIEKYLPFALAEAKKLVPDAVLFRIDADGVYPDGHADIMLAEHGSLDFRFISPSRSKPDPKLPVGAKQEYKCMFRIMIDGDGAWSAPLDGWECNEPLLAASTRLACLPGHVPRWLGVE
jgi:hypothetical protein